MWKQNRLFNTFKIITKSFHETKIGILGVPYDKGGSSVGIAKAPDVIRKADLINKITSIRKFSILNAIQNHIIILYNKNCVVGFQMKKSTLKTMVIFRTKLMKSISRMLCLI